MTDDDDPQHGFEGTLTHGGNDAVFDGLTFGGVHHDLEQSNEIIRYARDKGHDGRRAAELLAEIKGWQQPRDQGRPWGRRAGIRR